MLIFNLYDNFFRSLANTYRSGHIKNLMPFSEMAVIGGSIKMRQVPTEEDS